MLSRITVARKSKPDGESPFWISFSDLMSALMVLFLVVMAVTLMAVRKEVEIADAPKIQRESDIRELMSQINELSREFPQVKVNESTYRIDLGDIVRFDSGSANIQPAAALFLRQYVPILLEAQNSEIGQRWIRRIVVEGFTDQDGTYLYNLGLSLNRSRSVVCVLFASPTSAETPLNERQRRQIRDLFLVGGYSFNSTKSSKDASRRVELKLDFWRLDEERDNTNATDESPSNAETIDSKGYGRC